MRAQTIGGLVVAVLTVGSGVVLAETVGAAEGQAITVAVAVDKRKQRLVGTRGDANRSFGHYKRGTQVTVVCQDEGPSYGDSTVWDFTSERVWIPDGWAQRGRSGYLDGVQCGNCETQPGQQPPGGGSCPTELDGAEPHVAQVGNHLKERFAVGTVYGRGDRPGGGDHPAGLALDFMIDSAIGDQLADYTLANQAAFGVKYVIWKQRINSGDGRGWRQMEDRGSVTANHFDHVHVSFNAAAAVSVTCGNPPGQQPQPPSEQPPPPSQQPPPSQPPSQQPQPPGQLPPGDGAVDQRAAAVIAAARSQLGVPYSWGGGGKQGPSNGICCSPSGINDSASNGFDCSGFTEYAFWKGANIDIGGVTTTQYAKGRKVGYDQLKPGDLLFQGSGDDASSTTHVGIFIGDGQVIHANRSGGVNETTLDAFGATSAHAIRFLD